MAERRVRSHGTAHMKRAAVREAVKKPAVRDDNRVMKKLAKTSPPQKPGAQRVTKSADKIIKVSPAKAEERKPTEAPSEEPTSQGYYELNPLMSRMVDAELQDIMINIWQALPDDDDAPNEAEKLVAGKFRSKAGDDLRNAIGLNVTKRLLNVHNDLFVKIIFAKKPLRADLDVFIKNYNVTAFRKVGENKYVAKLQSLNEFDELCLAKNLKCGKVATTVAPCYSFVTCPQNLRTCYGGIGNDDKKANKKNEKTVAKKVETEQNKSTPQANQRTTENKTGQTPKSSDNQSDSKDKPTTAPKVVSAAKKANSAVEKETVTTENIKPANTAAANKTETIVETVKQAAPSNVKKDDNAKIVAAKSTATVSKQNVASKSTPAKTSQPATETKQITTQKVTPTKPSQETKQNIAAKTTPNQENKKIAVAKATPNHESKQNVPQKATPSQESKQNATAKVTPTKPNQNTATAKITPAKPNPDAATTNVTPAKPSQESKQNTAKTTSTKQSQENNQNITPAKSNQENKQSVAPKSTAAKLSQDTKPKATPAKLVKSPTKEKQTSSKKKQSDFDELDDHDILALISEGIVLDECSGSED